MTRPLLDADRIRAAVLADMPATLDSLGIARRESGSEARTRSCPVCGERSERSVSIDLATGLWQCFPHGCRGDVFALIAGYEQLDIAADYRRVLERAAQIAGIAGDVTPEREAELAAKRRSAAELRERAEAARAKARARMPIVWAALEKRHAGGEAYLRDERGVDPHALRRLGDVVRYSRTGQPAVALRDLETGDVVGVQYRRTLPGEPRTPLEPGSSTVNSALCGRLDELAPDGVDVAVLAEGLVDTLAAHRAFAGCAIFGAPGAGQYASVAAAVAERVRECRGWLLLIADDDDAGVTAAVAAVKAAELCGLALDRDLHLVDLGEHKDLADAWRAGWRWQWPTIGGAA
jgi:phage/plasmid primase-like uncharacterized protein